MNFKRLTIILTTSLVVVLSLLVIIHFQSQSNELEVIFLDVGQGDSILIKSPYGQQILIDGGPNNRVLKGLSDNLPFWEKDIELMILTHPHADHVVGLVEVLRRYEVDKVFDTGVSYSSSDYLTWLAEIEAKKIPYEVIKAPQQISLGPGLKLEILYPNFDMSGQKIENVNNASIISRLVYQENQFLFTGDAEEEEEQELLHLGVDLTAQVFKAGHHGSNTASTIEFLDQVQPEIVIIQSGQDNKFGHPHLRTIRNLEKRGIEIYRNDQQGEVKIVSDGRDLEIFTEL